MSDEIKRIPIKEFRALGFLQEANRQFFHPHGLALEVVIDTDTGEERLGGIWDYRDDPEGVLYGNLDERDRERAADVLGERLRHLDARDALFHDSRYHELGLKCDVEPLGYAYPDEGSSDESA